jgi:thymidylate synthase (FAD)
LFDFIKCRVIGVTQPVVDFIPDSEGIISYAARVSAPQNQSNFDTAAKLLKYCVDHQHYSVFETCNITMEIEAPRDIARQILRHRSFSFQEFSQRYAESTDFITRECRLLDTKNRQNSIKLDPTSSEVNSELYYWWIDQQNFLLEEIKHVYERALEQGIAKEVARCILPEGLTMSKMYMNGTVRSWLHYCSLREANGTQLEHQDVAIKCKEEVVKFFPFLKEVMEK